MRPWEVDAIQNSGLSKQFVDFENSSVSVSISLFVEKLYLNDQYNKTFTTLSSSNLIKYCQDYWGFQEVSFFVWKTKGNATGSDW